MFFDCRSQNRGANWVRVRVRVKVRVRVRVRVRVWVRVRTRASIVRIEEPTAPNVLQIIGYQIIGYQMYFKSLDISNVLQMRC